MSSPRFPGVTDRPTAAAGRLAYVAPPWATLTRTSPRDVGTGTSVATTQLGTPTKSTATTRSSSRCTRAVTRPDGTSITTSTLPVAGAATRPVSTAHTPSAMVPCPHAVEKPSLCQNSTPRWAPSSSGGTTNPPYMSACPRGSEHNTARRPWTPGSSIALARRSATVEPGIGTGGAATIRKGSPPVW